MGSMGSMGSMHIKEKSPDGSPLLKNTTYIYMYI
jgi:hypothetical protein